MYIDIPKLCWKRVALSVDSMKYLVFALLVIVVDSQATTPNVTDDDWYIVGVPLCIRPGLPVDIYVDIIKRVSVDVQVDLYNKTTGQVLVSNTKTIHPGHSDIVQLSIPQDLSHDWRYYKQYYIRITGRVNNDVVFRNETEIAYNSRNVTGFVQTDKPIYKPGQTVNYRIFSLTPNLQLSKGAYDIEIRDPKKNKIRAAKGVTSQTGLVSGSLELSDEPVFGIWSMTIFSNDLQFWHSFEVREYVLPRIEVTVTPPPFMVKNQPFAEFTIDAKYTFGEDVRGNLLVTAKNRWWYWSRNEINQPVVQKRFPDFSGSVMVNFTKEEMAYLNRNGNLYNLKVEANLTEYLTGSVSSASGYTTIYNTAEVVKFETSSATTFKPGLTYTVFARVTKPDGTPISGQPDDLVVQVQYTHPLKESEISTTTRATFKPLPEANSSAIGVPEPVLKQSGFSSWYPRYVTKNLTELTLQVPSDGIVEINVRRIPKIADSMYLKIWRNGRLYSWGAQRSYSPSNTFIQLIVVKELRRPGQRQKLRISSTVPIKSFSLLVTSRGRVVLTREEERVNAFKRIGLSFLITRDMAPRARVVAYFRTESGEIVPDVVTFNVLEPIENTVSIGFSQEEVQPGQDVDMIVRTAPYSMVATRVIDKKVLLLKADNDITDEQVTNSLWSYDSCGYYSRWLGGGIVDRRRRKRSFVPWRYPYHGSGNDAVSIFLEAGLRILSDSLLYAHSYNDEAKDKIHPETAIPDDGLLRDGLQEVEKLRTNFPETWLFMVEIANEDGFVNITTTAPDSITSWQATAFAFNEKSGFGITTAPAKLTVVKPFFANLFLPYSIIRGELLFLQVNVFNYLAQTQNVVVELQGSDDYEYLDIDNDNNIVGTIGPVNQTIDVASGIPKLVIFPIRALTLGQIPITVTARSTEAADGLTKTIRVEPEGVPAEYNFVELVNLTSSLEYQATRPINYPPGLVVGSEKLGVKLIGDVLGNTVANLANLVRMSYGCGEQNMVNFAPTVFVSKYLKSVGQLTDERLDNALNYIAKGYQRQMNYQRNDSSFSTFGNRDQEGSLWLSAFVAKSFSAAAQEGLLDIEEDVLRNTFAFVISKQSKDGSFFNTGKLHNKRLQGQSGKGNGLTAYVLAALFESNMADSFEGSISKAQAFVEDYVAASTDIYELAIGAYALALAGSPQLDGVLSRLETLTTTKDGQTYWEVEAEPIYRWEPPTRRTKAASIEATSYVCMVYAMKKDMVRSSQCLTYLVSQQNDYGGFVSTQDTVVAVQALSAIGPFFRTPTQSGSVTVSAAGESVSFVVNEQNSLELQEETLPVSANSVYINGTGTGVFLVSLSVKYNVDDDFIQPAFNLTTTITRDTPSAIDLTVCANYLAGKASGMANIEIRLPSGFMLTDGSEEDLIAATKRIDVSDGKVLLYFDEITYRGVCVYITAAGNGNINRPKPSSVRVFDYYDPEKAATAFYRMTSLDNDFCEAACTDDSASCSTNCAKRRRK